MKKARFSEDQMVRILREADQAPVAEVAKKHGINDQTIYLWRKRFRELEAVDVKRLRQLESRISLATFSRILDVTTQLIALPESKRN